MNTISIGELRQNPTRVLREVKAGETYTITDHGEPVAEITPRRASAWVPSGRVGALLEELGADEAWEREIAASRETTEITDPWEDRE